jgi:hypothetical protein
MKEVNITVGRVSSGPDRRVASNILPPSSRCSGGLVGVRWWSPLVTGSSYLMDSGGPAPGPHPVTMAVSVAAVQTWRLWCSAVIYQAPWIL